MLMESQQLLRAELDSPAKGPGSNHLVTAPKQEKNLDIL